MGDGELFQVPPEYGVWIYLDDEQMQDGAQVGQAREESSRRRGCSHRYGYNPTPEESLYNHIQGARAELAAAVALDVTWHRSVDAPKHEPDIGTRTQVRWSSKPWRDLLVREDDWDDQLYVQVVGDGPEFRVCGWCWGDEAKQDHYLRDLDNGRPPCYLVPQEELHPISPKA